MANPKPETALDTGVASHIIDHAFMPKGSIAEGEWWTTCGHEFEDSTICNMAEAAHRDTTLTEKDRITDAKRVRKLKPV